MKRKRILSLLSAALMLLSLLTLTACGDDYPKGTVDVPSNWASYTLSSVSFRFAAGYTTADWESLSEELQNAAQLLGGSNKQTLLGYLVSPEQALGTQNTLTVGYYVTASELTGEDLENIFPAFAELDEELEKLGYSTVVLQGARIRSFKGFIALSYAISVEKDCIKTALQLALVPHGNRVYQIVYGDFTTVEDDSSLERLLSSLNFGS